MPTVNVLGMHLDRKQLLIGGGLIAAAVAVIVWIRARNASATATAAPADQPQDTGGYGMSVGAPTGQVADAYQQQLQNSELEANSIANQYQRNLVAQQQKQFDFQQSINEQLAPEILANEKATLAADTAYETTKAKIPVACPPHYARARDVEGNLVCNPKGSGNPVSRAYQGVEDESYNLGRRVAEDAYTWATAQYLPPTPKRMGKKQQERPKSTPPIAPPSSHGYEVTYI